VKKGDRISIYLPMILELVIAMLACARIGAIHSVVVRASPVHCCSGAALGLGRVKERNWRS